MTAVFTDNHASQGVARALGYQYDGIDRDARGEEVLVSDHLRLTRESWRSQRRPEVEATGLAACRHLFER